MENVYIGQKPLMSYVMATLATLNSDSEVKILARGKAISKAVDVAEVVRKRFMTSAKIKGIFIGTETVSGKEEGEKRNISTIEIELSIK